MASTVLRPTARTWSTTLVEATLDDLARLWHKLYSINLFKAIKDFSRKPLVSIKISLHRLWHEPHSSKNLVNDFSRKPL
ncbi:hypothetical protein JTE90_013199 [Oedothorax gibbosus]|uniref:Uncharacterized protein n=1 Tax=Oedothorax gibbosus TaxID=931172 RepID=A0AAV6UIL1_9ARAC|nr:hypothetical protein JTE90_013199 [Oedothorax gibbosus]